MQDIDWERFYGAVSSEDEGTEKKDFAETNENQLLLRDITVSGFNERLCFGPIKDLRDEVSQMFSLYCEKFPGTRSLSTLECVRDAFSFQPGCNVETNRRGEPYVRFQMVVSQGIRTLKGEHVLLVELLPDSDRALPQMALPTSIPSLVTKPPKFLPKSSQVESFFAPVALIVHLNPETKCILKCEFLNSTDAYLKGLWKLEQVDTEVSIWRTRLPFAAHQLLHEQSALLAKIVSDIENHESGFALLHEQQVIESKERVFVIGITKCQFDNPLEPYKLHLSVVLARGRVYETCLPINSFEFNHQHYVAKLDRQPSGLLCIKLKLLDASPYSLNKADFSDMSDLYLLQYRKLISCFGAERVRQYFSGKQLH